MTPLRQRMVEDCSFAISRPILSAPTLQQMRAFAAHFGRSPATVGAEGIHLGHASLQPTSIYVRAEVRRMLEAAARYYDENAG